MKFDISRRTFLRTTIGTLLVGPYVWTALLRKDSCFGNLNVLASDTTVLEWKETQERFFQKWKRFCSKGFPPIRYTELGKRTATIRCWEAKQYVFGGMSVQVNGDAADVSDITAENLQSFDVIQGVVTLSDKPQYAVLDVKQHYRFRVGYESPPPNRKKSDSGSGSYAKIQAEAKKTGRTAFVDSNGRLIADWNNVSGVFGKMNDEKKKILNAYASDNVALYAPNNPAPQVWKDSSASVREMRIFTEKHKDIQVGNPVKYAGPYSYDMPTKVDSIVRYNGCEAVKILGSLELEREAYYEQQMAQHREWIKNGNLKLSPGQKLEDLNFPKNMFRREGVELYVDTATGLNVAARTFYSGGGFQSDGTKYGNSRLRLFRMTPTW